MEKTFIQFLAENNDTSEKEAHQTLMAVIEDKHNEMCLESTACGLCSLREQLSDYFNLYKKEQNAG